MTEQAVLFGRLVVELGMVQAGIQPILGQQLVVFSDFNDPAAVDHQNLVGGQDGA